MKVTGTTFQGGRGPIFPTVNMARDFIRAWTPELRALGGWRRTAFGIRRGTLRRQCPITALCHARGLGRYRPNRFLRAAALLGVQNPAVATLIAAAADRPDPVPETLRRFSLEGVLTEACGLDDFEEGTGGHKLSWTVFDEVAE